MTSDPLTPPPETILKVLVFTDIVGSTDMKQRLGDAAGAAAIAKHDGFFRTTLRSFNGHEEVHTGDGFFATFDRPSDAARFAVAFQIGLSTLDVPEPMETRIGIHMGEIVQVSDEGKEGAQSKLSGLAVDIASRVMGLGEGKQILLTRGVFDASRQLGHDRIKDLELEWLAHGPYLLKGIDEAIDIFEVGIPGFSPLAGPPNSEKAKSATRAGDEITLGWRPAAGLVIPTRKHWILEKNLGEGGFGEVWLAKHEKQKDRRVFKFCFEADRLRGLKREVTLFRLIKETLGDREDIAKLLDWNFDETPFFIEIDFTEGGDLKDWAKEQGGMKSVPMETRIELMAQVATALAAAHSVGVIHKDIKAGNVLVSKDVQGNPHAVLTDFGIGAVKDKSLLEAKGITVTGITAMDPDSSSSSAGTGTRLYMAPEIVEGKVASTPADIYALGVLLYQVIYGDFSHALAPGWERDVEDDFLREDIAACVDGNPERRLPSATELASRLRGLNQRHADRETERQAKESARLAKELEEQTRRELEKTNRRHRALLLYSGLGLAFTVIVTILAIRAYNDRNAALVAKVEADEQRALADEQRALADERGDLAEKRAREFEKLLYLVHLGRADQAFVDRDYTECGKALEACPIGPRGWEWQYLKSQVDEKFPLQLPGSQKPWFTRDGTRLIAAGMRGSEDNKAAIIWDLATGIALRKFRHERRVVDVAIGPHETLLASGDEDGTLKLWNLESGKEIWSVQAHTERLHGLSFSPDGRSIASVSRDGYLKVWNTKNRDLRFANSRGQWLRKVIFSPDGKRIVSGLELEENPIALRIASATSGEIQFTFPTDGQLTMAYSPNGQWLATCVLDGMIRIYDAASGEERRAWSGHEGSIRALEYSADGSKLASAGRDNLIKIWDSTEGRQLDWVKAGVAVYWLSFNPEGDRVALYSIEHGIRFWNLSKAHGKFTVQAHEGATRSVTFSPNNKYLASTGDDSVPKSFRDFFASMGENHQVRLWDPSNGERISPLGDIQGSCVDFTPNNELVVAATGSGENEFMVFETPTGRKIRTFLGRESEVTAISVSPDGRELASLEVDYRIRMWDFQAGAERNLWELTPPTGTGERIKRIFLAFARDGKKAATAANWEFLLEVWDLKSGKLLRKFPTPGFPIMSIAISPDAKKVALGSFEGLLWVFDVDGNEESKVIVRFGESALRSVEFSPNGQQVVSGDSLGVVRVWDTETLQPMVTLSTESEEVADLEWSWGGEMIAAARWDGTIDIWRLGSPQGELEP